MLSENDLLQNLCSENSSFRKLSSEKVNVSNVLRSVNQTAVKVRNAAEGEFKRVVFQRERCVRATFEVRECMRVKSENKRLEGESICVLSLKVRECVCVLSLSKFVMCSW